MSSARAHESPAEAPLFAQPASCIEVIDPGEQKTLDIAYTVPLDDVELTAGDIAVEDAKTHQFFAFRGALHPLGFNYQLYPFDTESDGETFPAMLPVWITVSDVKRSAEAADPMTALFVAEDVPLGAVLAGRAELADRWLRITADDARVPITMAQAQKGVSFDLTDVEPGLYTIAGYIFSPPYNAWAVRPGIVKVVSDTVDPPVAVLGPIHAFAYSHQGRRVSGCVDAPEGTQLRGLFRIEERPEAGVVEWLPAQPVESGRLELCFHNPRPELTGSVRLLFELESPDGTLTRVISPDTMTALSGHGSCTPSGGVCCDFEGAVLEEPMLDGGAAGAAGASSAAGGAAPPPDAADGGPSPARRPISDSGCAVAGSAAGASAIWIAWACAGLFWRRRRP